MLELRVRIQSISEVKSTCLQSGRSSYLFFLTITTTAPLFGKRAHSPHSKDSHKYLADIFQWLTLTSTTMLTALQVQTLRTRPPLLPTYKPSQASVC